METVVGDISGAIQQLKNLSNVRLKKCCDELTRGVVEGLRRKQTPQHQVPFSPGKPLSQPQSMYLYYIVFQCLFCEECGLLYLVLDTLSESDGSLSLNIDTEYGKIEFKEQSLHVEGM